MQERRCFLDDGGGDHRVSPFLGVPQDRHPGHLPHELGDSLHSLLGLIGPGDRLLGDEALLVEQSSDSILYVLVDGQAVVVILENQWQQLFGGLTVSRMGPLAMIKVRAWFTSRLDMVLRTTG